LVLWTVRATGKHPQVLLREGWRYDEIVEAMAAGAFEEIAKSEEAAKSRPPQPKSRR